MGWRRLCFSIRFAFLFSLVNSFAVCAAALVTHTDDKALSSVSPFNTLGWQNVGPRGSVTAIYIGNGWMLTAQHVAPGGVILDGVSYSAVPESRIRLADPEGGTVQPDLAVFRIHPSPELGELAISSSAPAVGEPVVMVGGGRDRGEKFTWNGIAGFSLTSTRTKRWGSNRIEEAAQNYTTTYTNTRGFSTSFDPFDTRHEAQAVNGDSGGAVFIKRRGKFELAGVIFSIAKFPNQPEDSSLYGNRSYAADLSHYRKQLLELIRTGGTTIQRTSDVDRAPGKSPVSDPAD